MNKSVEEIKNAVDREMRLVNAEVHLSKIKEALLKNDYRNSPDVSALFADVANICKSHDARFITRAA